MKVPVQDPPALVPLKRRDFILFLLLACGALAEFFLVRNYYAENITPYYPRMWDQIATYQHVYRAHYLIRDQGILAALAPGGPIADLAFKSTLVPVTGTFLTFLFGPNRFSVGLVNFLIFLAAQILVVGSLYRAKGATAGLAGWGLLLLSQSHWINGLFDLRFDYAGLLAFGLEWVGMVSYLANPTKKTLGYFCLALCFCAGARSISLVYSVTTAGIVFGTLLLVTLLSRGDNLWKRRLVSAGIMLGSALAVIVAYTASQWFTLRSYYGGQIGTLAGEIRWAEVGALFMRDRLIWYPLNWWPHYSKIIIVSLAVISFSAITVLAMKLWHRKSSSLPLEPLTETWPWTANGALGLLAAATLAVFVSSPVVGPNIAVLGMLTIPTAITMAMIVNAAVARTGSLRCQWMVVGLVAILGAADWTLGIFSAREMNAAWRERGEVGRQVLDALATNAEARENPSILFLWTHDIFNPEALQGFQMETRHKLPPKARYNLSGIGEVTPEWLQSTINWATCVVGYVNPPYLAPGQYEWPSSASIRKRQEFWQPILDRDFELVGSWRQPCEYATIGLWVRKVTFGHIEAPGLETSTAGTPAFWVRPDPFPAEIINATKHDLSVVLRAPAWPGPGREGTARVSLVVRLEGQSPVTINVSAENTFQMRIPLVLRPGKNTVWLSAHETTETTPLPHNGLSVFLPELYIEPAPSPAPAPPLAATN